MFNCKKFIYNYTLYIITERSRFCKISYIRKYDNFVGKYNVVYITPFCEKGHFSAEFNSMRYQVGMLLFIIRFSWRVSAYLLPQGKGVPERKSAGYFYRLIQKRKKLWDQVIIAYARREGKNPFSKFSHLVVKNGDCDILPYKNSFGFHSHFRRVNLWRKSFPLQMMRCTPMC